jgi:hypothetical protein
LKLHFDELHSNFAFNSNLHRYTKAGVELREGAAGARTVGNGLSYISIMVPYGIRVSRIYEVG